MSISNAEILQIYSLTGLGKSPVNLGATIGKNPIAQTMPVEATVSTVTPATGVMDLTAIYLVAGQTISSIAFLTVGAATGPTHWWFALYDDGRGSSTAGQLALLGQTPDQVAGALGANTAIPLSLITPWITQYTGIYYIAFLLTVSTTMATLAGLTKVSTAGIQLSLNCANSFHSLTAGSGLTNAAPNPSGALTISTRTEYGVVS
jgi:hypothetical protein